MLAVVALGGYSLYSWALSRPAALPDKLVVGIDYVAPAFVGGAKVRTADVIDTEVVDALAVKLGVPVEMTLVHSRDDQETLGSDSANLSLGMVDMDAAAEPGMLSIPLGYVARPMVIMRTDTDILQWQQLLGRTVCVSQNSHYVGWMDSHYGAIERVYPAPADALLALRTGECDAAVHDDVLLNELLRLPEWKKFSAHLVAEVPRQLRWLVAADQTELAARLQQSVSTWQKQALWPALNQRRARDIAFEVYLDQVVTDCH